MRRRIFRNVQTSKRIENAISLDAKSVAETIPILRTLRPPASQQAALWNDRVAQFTREKDRTELQLQKL